MRLLTFKKGVHIPDHKSKTNQCAIVDTPPTETYVFSLGQNGGAPCVPLVQKGDRVLMGQKIADSEALMSAPIHSSVSGEVIAIEPRLTNKGMQTCIVVKNDFLDETVPAMKEQGHSPKTAEEIIKIVHEAGIIGLGGAGFPTHIKLAPPKDKVITEVIVNAAECEPYLTSDHRVLLEETDDVIRGLLLVMQVFGLNAGGHIAIEENKPDAIALMKKQVPDGITVDVLKKKYPQGSEKHLIYAVTGREVPTGGLPADAGVVVINADTAASISRAVYEHRPVLERVVTVAGGAVNNPGNYRTRVGTPLSAVIEAAGGFSEEPAKLILGGPMMGVTIPSVDLPATKTTSGLLAFTAAEAEPPVHSHCIRCGRCASLCPMNLLPLELDKKANLGDWDACKELHILSCIECGCCTYICPAGRRIIESIRRAKTEIRAQGRRNG